MDPIASSPMIISKVTVWVTLGTMRRLSEQPINLNKYESKDSFLRALMDPTHQENHKLNHWLIISCSEIHLRCQLSNDEVQGWWYHIYKILKQKATNWRQWARSYFESWNGVFMLSPFSAFSELVYFVRRQIQKRIHGATDCRCAANVPGGNEWPLPTGGRFCQGLHAKFVRF